ncbi:oligosaccharide flippase family protein [Secundilactobacillus oryzae]|uniref:oligosaccharide flippase family protein n=1 Tax=Secundilactobacillus oryzae TaxID=1202668 RepID=UPI0006D0111F|nr:oligosaccharide flippase family protein [Secundilactobacillus oryzae]
MKSKTTSTILKGAVILSVTSLLVKILSAFYRIPFQNMVGNEGFYVYQQVYPIYGIAMTLALSGVPVFISRVIAEYDEPAERIMVARRLFSILLVVAWGLFAGLQLFAPQLASVMGDGGLTAEIRAATWLFVLVPFLAVSRGYFQGQLDMVPTSQSQLAEQVVRVGVILFAAYYGMQKAGPFIRLGRWPCLVPQLLD